MAATLNGTGGVFVITELGDDETSPVVGPIADASCGTITAVDGGDSGFNSVAVTIEGSISGNSGTFVPVKDTTQTIISFSVAGHVEVSTALRYFRAVGASGLSNVDLEFRFK